MRSYSDAWRAGLLGCLLALTACGGDGDAPGGGSGSEAEPPATPPGIPVSQPTGPVDEALAETGERAFQARGCVACHTVGEGRLVGPDLAGVTERRTFEWYYHMVTNPDSMTQNDPTARQLLAEYMTPMLDQGATPEEVRAMWEYLRHEGSEVEEHDEEHDA